MSNKNNNNKVFTFASGYTVAVRADYNPKTIPVLMSAWDAEFEKSKPQPPVEMVPAKGGTKRALTKYNDPTYQANLRAWETRRMMERAEFHTATLIEQALDENSIDHDAVKQARQAMKYAYGTTGDPNDLQFYLSIVASMGNGNPGDPDYEINEMEALGNFVAEQKGPPGALIEHLLRGSFRHDHMEQNEKRLRGYLGSGTKTGKASDREATGEVDTDSGG